jgi:hypothetical protein
MLVAVRKIKVMPSISRPWYYLHQPDASKKSRAHFESACIDSTLDLRGRCAVDSLSPDASLKPREGDGAPVIDLDRTRSRPKKSRASFDPARMDSPLVNRRGLGRNSIDGRPPVMSETEEPSDESEPENDDDGSRAGVPWGVGEPQTELFSDGMSSE